MSEADKESARGSPGKGRHRNDIYGRLDRRSEDEEGVVPPIAAATVVLLRDAEAGPEVLMLRKNSKITFGGMWVFPGGKIDAEDFGTSEDPEVAARNAAAREADEEASILLRPDEFVWFAHWTPPPGLQKRFATWFFAAIVDDEHDVDIDQGEIDDHAWIRPGDALARHSAGEIDMVPPTWVTLYHLSLYTPCARILDHFRENEAKTYSTRVGKTGAGDRVAMWHGDAGYESWDANAQGHRHRLVMARGGFTFENSIESY
ncbi:MAG: NUDIX hydrolase [Pseudomonadales bacterium]|jgi:8-oxo-dGTP pyrophosphatase MutT (NUDIX family)|nr:NUDIX hydrolase [Pseudomonadales bacterium]MDP6472246.1 NUDIX hydrolase [Pseudomonadales bacterium]MDP6826502.1 NUDIX hydrolase [Pseudomonadales bacterium]MDP6970687.1 NUDIX hydrolase [Pseudomonadales bacterium]|tara:strand:+ start:4555 stop:5334 length:780 start_codon:yes stop_codon:yes gene_type:complete